jgi:hypothetical protein
MIPRRFVDKIKQGADDQGERRQTRRRGKFADHHVVYGEVQSRDDDPEGDGLGYRLFDRGPGKRDEWRLDVRPATPVAITPTVAAVVTRACVSPALSLAGADTGWANSNSLLASTLSFDKASPPSRTIGLERINP